jgi:adenylylsulfate kinase
MEKLSQETHHSEETLSRSITKTITYRVLILICDFTCIYLFTGKLKVAVGFTIVSNVYTTIGYFLHERVWDKIKWGKNTYKQQVQG